MIKCSGVSQMSLLKAALRGFFWLRVKPCHTLRLFSFFSGQPSWMRIKSFPLEWRLLCSKSSYIVNLVGDTPMNWYIFWVLSCSRDSSQKFRSSSWSTSTEQNFPCELCIFSRKQSGFLGSRFGTRAGVFAFDTFFPLPHLLAALRQTWLHGSWCF